MSRRWVGILVMIALGSTPARPCAADAVLGFTEEFPGTSIGTWGGGALVSNPGTGGVGGAGDGFLLVAQPSPARLGARSSGPEYGGDWFAANIAQLRLWLSNLGSPDPLEIHVAIGTFGNLWQYDPGFVPPTDGWSEFAVDLTDSTQFSHIIDFEGRGFAAALQGVAVVLVRHDQAPFQQVPDFAAGDFGIDRIRLLGPDPTRTLASTWGRIKRLYR